LPLLRPSHGPILPIWNEVYKEKEDATSSPSVRAFPAESKALAIWGPYAIIRRN